MFYHVDFHIEYQASMSQKDFFSIWSREAEAVLGAKKAGVCDALRFLGCLFVVANPRGPAAQVADTAVGKMISRRRLT